MTGEEDKSVSIKEFTLVHDNEDVDFLDTEASRRESRPINVGLPLMDSKDPRTIKVRKMRTLIGTYLVKLSNFFQQKREDDVEAILVLTKCIGQWITQYGITILL